MRLNSGSALKVVNFSKWLRGALLPLLLQPAFMGAVFSAAISSGVLVSTLRNDQYEGADATSVRQFLSGEYQGEMLRALGLVLALSTLVGLILGLLVGLVTRWRQAWLGRKRLDHFGLAKYSSVGIVVTYGVVWLDDVAARPALYQDALYERGGFGAALQILITNHFGRLALWTLAGILTAAWALLPLIRSPSAKSQLRSLGALVLAVALGTLLLCFPWRRIVGIRAGSASGKRLNVLVIAADSLRPDRITPNTAPRLYALAQSGTSFEQAYTPLARTFPAWVSILTGNYPHHHGIRNMFPRWETRSRDFEAIPKAFANAGYATSVVSDFAGDIFRRIDLGFRDLRTPTFTMRELLLERILQKNVALLPWLRGPLARWAVPVLREMHVASDAQALTQDALSSIDAAGNQPFFATVFYSTTHFPYAAPAPYYRQFVSPGYRGKYRYAKADTLASESALSLEDVRQVRGLFDGAVAAVDAAVGDLLDGLTARGLRDRTIIVITADHGESLYENGRGQGHGDHLYGEESLRVPMIVVTPDSPRRQVQSPVSSIDLAPTLCELAQVTCSKNIDGQSLVSALQGRPLPSRPIFSETGLWFTETVPEVPLEKRIPYPDLIHLTEIDKNHSDEVVIRRQWEPVTIAAKHRMIRDGRFKLVYIPTRRGPSYELFDTSQDPGETNNIAESQGAIVQQLKPKLLQWILEDLSLERQGEVVMPRLDSAASRATR